VQLRVAGSTNWGSEATTTSTEITASSLSNTTTYEWHVRTNCASGSSDYSATCSFTAGNSNSSACSGARIGDESWVKAFPNPTSGSLTLQVNMPVGQGLYVDVMDATGRVSLRDFIGEQTDVELDLSDVPSGMYFVQITNGVDREVIRIMRD